MSFIPFIGRDSIPAFLPSFLILICVTLKLYMFTFYLQVAQFLTFQIFHLPKTVKNTVPWKWRDDKTYIYHLLGYIYM
jgi:hypothetical protein